MDNGRGSDTATLAIPDTNPPLFSSNEALRFVPSSDTSGNIWIAYSSTPEDASSWSKYQVQTSTSGATTNESTYSSPTLIAENGRLALYFPTNNNSASQQGVRYLYSRTPGESDSWGGSLVGSGYSGGKIGRAHV